MNHLQVVSDKAYRYWLLINEKKFISGKLSSAGSLYALYNEHSPDLPMGQIERRRVCPPFATLQRGDQQSAPL